MEKAKIKGIKDTWIELVKMIYTKIQKELEDSQIWLRKISKHNANLLGNIEELEDYRDKLKEENSKLWAEGKNNKGFVNNVREILNKNTRIGEFGNYFYDEKKVIKEIEDLLKHME